MSTRPHPDCFEARQPGTLIGRRIFFSLGMAAAIYGGYHLWGIWGAIIVWRLHPYFPGDFER